MTARDQFGDHLKKKQGPAQAEADVFTVGGLFSKFLAWVKEERSDKQYRRRRTDCSRFGRFIYEGRRLADVPALEVTGAMLEAWQAKQQGVLGEAAWQQAEVAAVQLGPEPLALEVLQQAAPHQALPAPPPPASQGRLVGALARLLVLDPHGL
jgi:hypothetical protein